MRHDHNGKDGSLGEHLENEWESLRVKLDEIAATCQSATENIDEIIGLLEQALAKSQGREPECGRRQG